MPIENTTFRPDVVRRDRHEYDAAVQSFIEAFDREDVRTIGYYQFGQVGHPGISDLDLLILVEDGDWRAARSVAERIIGSHRRFDYLFCHPPVVVSERAVPYLTYVHSLSHIAYLCGREDILGPHLSAGDPGTAFHVIRQAIWNSFLRHTITELKGTSIGLRRTLQLLNNMCHSIECGDALIGADRESPRPFLDFLRKKILYREGGFDDSEITGAIRRVKRRFDETDSRVDAYLTHCFGMAPLHRLCRPINSWIFFTTFDFDIAGGFRKRIRKPLFLDGVLLIPAPSYQFRIIASLSRHLADSHPRLRSLRQLRWAESTPAAVRFCSAIDNYGQHLSALAAICREEKVPYAFPAPFNITQEGWPRGDRLRSSIRQAMLTLLAMR